MSETIWNRKDLLGIEELSAGEIKLILDTAESFREVSERPIKKVPTLRGKTVVNLFLEPSTRTRSSFEIAEKRLSADSMNFSSSNSALAKGEGLIDTALTLQAMAPDMLVIRHQHPGVPHLLASRLAAGVINAGDGAHEHPTQALLDALTIRLRKGSLEGLKVSMVGDIEHSRVVRSNIHLLTKMGVEVTVGGLRTMLPVGIEAMGVRVVTRLEEAVAGADVIMMLRIQKERMGGQRFPSNEEYFDLFGLTRRHLEMAAPDALVMHPGPMNRGVEIASDVADGPQSVILDQVANGVAVRMAVLYLLSGVHQEAA